MATPVAPVQQWPFKVSVVPRVPEGLESLRNIAFNLWFSWNFDALELFKELDPALWEECGHSPVKMLRLIKQSRLEAAAKDKAYRERVESEERQSQAFAEHRSKAYYKQQKDRKKAGG